MQIQLPYGKESVELDIDEKRLLQVIEPAAVSASEPKALIETAVASPVNSPALRDFLCEPPLIIVNDATRPTPTSAILDVIAAMLPDETRFLVATGTHRAPNEDELVTIFGSHLERFRQNIYSHDSWRECLMVGITSFGTEVKINNLCCEAERIIVIGSVEPHYFAGYTGGRKAFLPGTAAYSSIEQNHKYAMHPDSAPLALEGNPVHDDQVEAMHLLDKKHLFSIQAVLDRNQNIYAVTAGDIGVSFDTAVQKAAEAFVVPARDRADIVIAVAAPPLDATLYQAHKAIENTKHLLNENGTMILVAECPEGIGNNAFVRLLSSSSSPAKVSETIREGYKLGYHKASKLADLILDSDVYVASSLPPEQIEDIFMKPFCTPQEALDDALAAHGPDSNVIIVHDACVTVPSL